MGLFLRPLPPSVPPPLSPLNVEIIPVGPSRFSLPQFHTSCITHIRFPILPPLICCPAPLSLLISFASRDSGSPVLLQVCYRLSCPCATPSIGVFWCLIVSSDAWIIFLQVYFCALVRGQGAPTPWQLLIPALAHAHCTVLCVLTGLPGQIV